MFLQQFSIRPNTLARDYIDRCGIDNPFACEEVPVLAFPTRPIDGRKYRELGQWLADKRSYSQGIRWGETVAALEKQRTSRRRRE